MYQDMSSRVDGLALSLGFGVPQVVTAVVADGEVFLVAVATFAERLNVL
jgi:hypothetical protein